MPDNERKHDAVWARQLAVELKRRGHPVTSLLSRAGLNERSLNAEGARIPYAKHAAFFEIAAEVSGDSCLGLHFGQTRNTRDAGLIGYVGLSSPTVIDALKNLSRYMRVFTDACEMDIEDLEETGRLGWRYRIPTSQRDRQATEFTAANLVRGLRQMIGLDFAPISISFAHPRNEAIREFERYFGCPVGFAERGNVIEMKLSDLSSRIISADDRLLEVLRSYCEEILSKRSGRAPSLVEKVERVIADRLTTGEAMADNIAIELGMTRRTLARRLAQLGTSYNGLLDGLRKDLALRYLKDCNLSLKEIAFLLGYSEVSAFNHAFKRWTEKTPGQVGKAVARV